MSRLRTMYNKFHSGLASIVSVTSNIFLVLLTLIVFVEVIARYVFHVSHGFAEEWVRWLQVWILYMMGAIIFMKAGGHITVDVLFTKMNKNLQAIVLMVSDFFALIFAWVLFVGGWEVVQRNWELAFASRTEIAVPFWIPYLILPFAAVLIALFAGDHMVRTGITTFGKKRVST